ncbi:aminoacyl-tRNA hydrolase [Candidatus Saccharibacteria bacterium]|nr:aminoacyl-tRNA hydrolase [Candidatus Saccharibacteria bacterium]
MALFQRFQRNDQLIQVTQDIPTSTMTDDRFVALIVGLGNIGKKYDGTRHNIGFTVIDTLRVQHGLPEWQEKIKFKSLISEDFVGGKKVILAKPTTLMNNSGEAVRALKDFYKLKNSDITVIHDELDLPFGTIKQKQGGGSAGNNGIKSLIAHIGDDFKRVRMGIKNDQLDTTDSADFVLAKFSLKEKEQLDDIIQAAAEKIEV